MISVNYSVVRNNFKKYCDKVIKNCEIIVITRKNKENLVLMSEEEYKTLIGDTNSKNDTDKI